MLKIKDNVDLKVLEEYGFINKGSRYEKELKQNRENYFGPEYYYITIYISIGGRNIDMQNTNYDSDYACCIPDIIYDLIKADLVEKVEGN